MEQNVLLHAEISEVAKHLTGVDSDPEGIRILTENGWGDLIVADIENLEAGQMSRSIDVIVAGEIIEHLDNPGAFLEGVRKLMSPTTLLIVTTVNAYCGMRFVRYAIRGKGGKQEPVHPDHVAYYSYSTLNLLLERNGLKVENFYFYDLDIRLRPHTRWIIRFVNDICVFFSPQLADGVIAICKLGDVE